MQYRLMKYGVGKENAMFDDEMRMTVKHLCMEIDDPELYERFMMTIDKGIIFTKSKRFIDNNNEKEIDKK